MIQLTPKEISERLIDFFKFEEDETRYEANAMMFAHPLAEAYLRLFTASKNLLASIDDERQMRNLPPYELAEVLRAELK